MNDTNAHANLNLFNTQSTTQSTQSTKQSSTLNTHFNSHYTNESMNHSTNNQFSFLGPIPAGSLNNSNLHSKASLNSLFTSNPIQAYDHHLSSNLQLQDHYQDQSFLSNHDQSFLSNHDQQYQLQSNPIDHKQYQMKPSQHDHHQSSLAFSNFYQQFNKDTIASNGSSSFGYTPPFSRPSSASLLSLENHFSSTSFFGTTGLHNNDKNIIQRPTTPPDSSISLDGPLDTNLTSSTSSVLGSISSTLPSISLANPSSSAILSSSTSTTSMSNNVLGLSSANASDRPEAMRTLYFGNLPPDLHISEFLNYVRGGILEECKYLQQKNCVFVTFLEASVAASVYLEYQQNPFSIEGYECRVGWGKPSTLHPSIRNHVLKGATRNVFLGNLDPEITSDDLSREFSQFGMIDCVKVLPEKRIGFVHLCSVSAAIKAVAALTQLASLSMSTSSSVSTSSTPNANTDTMTAGFTTTLLGLSKWKWSLTRIYYGKDRCCTQPPPPPSTSPSLPEENRTVYIGGIHADVTTKDLCDVIRGGLLQQIKYFPEKNICFATFISATSASLFYERSVSEGLVLRSKRMKIGWGKPSMLPLSIANAVEKGASRNVYIGSIEMEGVLSDPQVCNAAKEALYAHFEEYGEIELVNIVPEKRIGFVCFTDIVSAMKAVEAMRNGGSSSENRLFRRVNFGKDRCANAFRPSKNSVSPPASPES